MRFFCVDGRRYATFERLADAPTLTHAFCTRPMDVAPRVDQRADERAGRRVRMAADLELEARPLFHCVQIHGNRVAFVDDLDAAPRLEGFDAVVTDRPDVALMTFSADCPLVLIHDPVKRVLAMVHASWRCTVARLTANVVDALQQRFGCNPNSILAGIGPSAGPQNYEVKDDVYAAAASLPDRNRLFPVRDGRMYFDLWEANRALLKQAGVPETNIETAGICTMERTDLFYSFRREGPGCGHFGLMAGLHAP